MQFNGINGIQTSKVGIGTHNSNLEITGKKDNTINYNYSDGEKGKKILETKYYPNGTIKMQTYLVKYGAYTVEDIYYDNGLLASKETKNNAIENNRIMENYSYDSNGNLTKTNKMHIEKGLIKIEEEVFANGDKTVRYRNDIDGKRTITKTVETKGKKNAPTGQSVKTYDESGKLIEFVRYINKENNLYEQIIDPETGAVTSENNYGTVIDGVEIAH